MMKKVRYNNAESTALLALLAAFAAVLSYVETLIPFNIWIPGVKLGLANIAIVVVIYFYGIREGFIVNIVRILLVGFLFGNMFSISFSVVGALVSLLAMSLAKKTELFTVIGVSVAGGVAHNMGQMLMSAIVVDSYSIIYYIPVLIIAGIIMGVVIGIVSSLIIKYTNIMFKTRKQ